MPVATRVAVASNKRLMIVQRFLPMPWVHVKRKVPLSSSLAINGAPRNVPTARGNARTTRPKVGG